MVAKMFWVLEEMVRFAESKYGVVGFCVAREIIDLV